MSYKTILRVSKGDIFHRAFAPVSWNYGHKIENKNRDVSLKLNNYSNTSFLANSNKKLELPKLSILPTGSLKKINFYQLKPVSKFTNKQLNPCHAKLIPNIINNIEKVSIRNKQFQVIDCGGGGNCFFHAISRGLQERNINRSFLELRQMLSDWFSDFDNARSFKIMFGASPAEIVPFLGHLAHHCPSKDGWEALTENWSWQDWGGYLRQDGRWAGGLEITPINLCFQDNGIDINVNLWKKDISLLCEETLESNTILLMLSYNHFYYLKEVK